MGTGESNGSGSSARWRSTQTRSPRTLREAQFRVERGGRKNSGLTKSQTSDSATGTSDHHPSQVRVQIARARRGSTVKRVHTLAGLA